MTTTVRPPTENQYRGMFTQAAGSINKARERVARRAFIDAINTMEKAVKGDPYKEHNPYLYAETARIYRAAVVYIRNRRQEVQYRSYVEQYTQAAQRHSNVAEENFHQALELLPRGSRQRAFILAELADVYLTFSDLFGEDKAKQMAVAAARTANTIAANETATRVIMALSERGVSWSEEAQRTFDERHRFIMMRARARAAPPAVAASEASPASA